MSGVNADACGRCGQPYYPAHSTTHRPFRDTLDSHVWTSPRVMVVAPRSQDPRAETDPQSGAVTGETGVPTVDTLRDTAPLTRLRDAARRSALALHDLQTETARARAAGHPEADVQFAVRVGARWPGVPQ